MRPATAAAAAVTAIAKGDGRRPIATGRSCTSTALPAGHGSTTRGVAAHASGTTGDTGATTATAG